MSGETTSSAVTAPHWLNTGLGMKLLLVIAGVVGGLAAGQLTIEKIRLLSDPNYVPSCSLNPILSCGSVMSSPQASAFGFANSLIGIASFAAVLTIGMGLFAGAAFGRWFWIGVRLSSIFGICFVHWLVVASLYDIQKLCLYCMVVWIAMIPTFVGVTLFNLRTGVIPLPEGARKFFVGLSRFAWAIVLIWYAIIFAMVIIQFPNVLSF